MLESSKGKAASLQTNINSVFQSVDITNSKILMHRMKKIISRRAQAPFKNQTMTNYRASLVQYSQKNTYMALTRKCLLP